MQFAPATYYASKTRPRSTRSIRDEHLKEEITRVFSENFSVYGVHKVWAQLNREGTRVARCTVQRLMRELGLQGARRDRAFKRIVADQQLENLALREIPRGNF